MDPIAELLRALEGILTGNTIGTGLKIVLLGAGVLAFLFGYDFIMDMRRRIASAREQRKEVEHKEQVIVENPKANEEAKSDSKAVDEHLKGEKR